MSSQLPKTKLFFISSTRVFNGHHNDILLDDDTPTNPSDPQGDVLANAERLITDTDDGIGISLKWYLWPRSTDDDWFGKESTQLA